MADKQGMPEQNPYVHGSTTATDRVKVFLSYSHKDEPLQRELDEQLGVLKHEDIIEVWWDRRLAPGDDWNKEILRELESARIILLLVSPSFLNSQFCYQTEMRHAVERHRAGLARVIPILLRPCYWNIAPFASIQGLPRDMKPVTAKPRFRRDEVWAEVVQGIHGVIISLREAQGSSRRHGPSSGGISDHGLTISPMIAIVDGLLASDTKAAKVSSNSRNALACLTGLFVLGAVFSMSLQSLENFRMLFILPGVAVSLLTYYIHKRYEITVQRLLRREGVRSAYLSGSLTPELQTKLDQLVLRDLKGSA
jgi:hypothetical protein